MQPHPRTPEEKREIRAARLERRIEALDPALWDVCVIYAEAGAEFEGHAGKWRGRGFYMWDPESGHWGHLGANWAEADRTVRQIVREAKAPGRRARAKVAAEELLKVLLAIVPVGWDIADTLITKGKGTP